MMPWLEEIAQTLPSFNRGKETQFAKNIKVFYMKSSKSRDKPKLRRELWLIEYDSSMSPRVVILNKKRIPLSRIKKECEEYEDKLFHEEVTKALKKVYS